MGLELPDKQVNVAVQSLPKIYDDPYVYAGNPIMEEAELQEKRLIDSDNEEANQHVRPVNEDLFAYDEPEQKEEEVKEEPVVESEVVEEEVK